MYTDNITITTSDGTLEYSRRSPKGPRSVFVPQGQTPFDEQRIEIAHEVTAAKRVNSLVKFARTQPTVDGKSFTESSVSLKVMRSATITAADITFLIDSMVFFLSSEENKANLYNQEQ